MKEAHLYVKQNIITGILLIQKWLPPLQFLTSPAVPVYGMQTSPLSSALLAALWLSTSYTNLSAISCPCHTVFLQDSPLLGIAGVWFAMHSFQYLLYHILKWATRSQLLCSASVVVIYAACQVHYSPISHLFPKAPGVAHAIPCTLAVHGWCSFSFKTQAPLLQRPEEV